MQDYLSLHKNKQQLRIAAVQLEKENGIQTEFMAASWKKHHFRQFRRTIKYSDS